MTYTVTGGSRVADTVTVAQTVTGGRNCHGWVTGGTVMGDARWVSLHGIATLLFSRNTNRETFQTTEARRTSKLVSLRTIMSRVAAKRGLIDSSFSTGVEDTIKRPEKKIKPTDGGSKTKKMPLTSTEKKRQSRKTEKFLEANGGGESPGTWDPEDFLTHVWYDFVCRLKLVTTVPKTNLVLKERLAAIKNFPKHDMMRKTYELLLYPEAYDLTIIETDDELEEALRKSFGMLKLNNSQEPLVPVCTWTIQKQIESMPKTKGQAHQPLRMEKNGVSTHDVEYEDMARIFLRPGEVRQEERGSNFLDIGNNTKLTFCTAAITRVSLIDQINRGSATAPWARGSQKQLVNDDWIILSKEESVSPFHADSAGCCTAVTGVDGEKNWFWLKGEWEEVQLAFQAGGPQQTSYAAGIASTVVKKGECM